MDEIIAKMREDGNKILGPPKKMEKKNAKQLGLSLNFDDNNNNTYSSYLIKRKLEKPNNEKQPIENKGPSIEELEEEHIRRFGPTNKDLNKQLPDIDNTNQMKQTKEEQEEENINAGGKKKTKKRKSSKKKTKKRKGKRKSGKKK